MQLLKKLSRIISMIAPGSGLSSTRAQMLSGLNPDKFYIENVRGILDVSYASAARICETAVRQGLFERRVEVRCPDGAVAVEAETEAALPELVQCWHKEDGFLETEELATSTLEKVVFYRFNDHNDSISYGQTA